MEQSVVARDKKAIGFLGVLSLYVFGFARIVIEFLDNNYNHDLETYIYFGREVQRGNPVWINEWSGPLLVRHFLFAIESPLGPVKTWIVISVGSAVLAVLCVAALLPRFLEEIGYKNEEARRAAILAGGIYLLVSGHMPSGFSHINVLPASMAIIALMLAFRLTYRSERKSEVVIVGVVAGLAAAVSISVREYFIFPLAIGFLFICLMILSQRVFSVRRKWYRVTTLLLSPALIGFGLNLGPYVYLGQGSAFFAQLGFVLQTPATGQFSITDVLALVHVGISPLRIWLAGMLLFSIVEIVVGFWRRSNVLAVTLIPVSAIVLAIGIESLHFWDHYMNFFSWYFSIILSARLVFLDRVFLPLMRGSLARFAVPSLMLPFALSAFAAVVLSVGVGDPSETPKATAVSHEHRNLAFAVALDSKLSAGLPSRASFFAPTNDYVHWKLEESRHGFPNSFMVGQIVSGKWGKLPEVSYTFRTPKNAEELCNQILESSIELVVLPIDDQLISPCFDSARTPWRYERLQVSDVEVWNLWWRE